MPTGEYGLARRMWHQLEPVHAVSWYAPELFAEAAALGYQDRLAYFPYPATIEVFAQRWLHRLPMPLSDYDEARGYWWELSMRQVEVSRTIVFDAPRRARAFFEALIADNLDVGRPASVEIIFGRRVQRNTGGTFRTTVDRPVLGPDTGQVILNVFYKHSRVKQYLNCDVRSHAVSEYVDRRFGSMLKT